MEILKINPKQNSPSVWLTDGNEGILKIDGYSILEYPEKFYQEIIDALDKLKVPLGSKKEKEITAIFSFKYLNSASVKCILQLLFKIKAFKSKVFWSYESFDEDMKETGEILETIVKIPFEFVKIEL